MTTSPASHLGYLLHTHPAHLHRRSTSAGIVRVKLAHRGFLGDPVRVKNETTEPVVDDRFHVSLCHALDAQALRILSLSPLAGGAIQDTRALDVEVIAGPHAGSHRWVLRRDAQSTIAESRTRLEEHALLVAAHGAGVTVPRPIACGTLPDGSAWSVVERLDGTGYGPKIVKTGSLGGDREALLECLGRELATIHGIDTNTPALGFLASEANATSIHGAATRELDRLCAALDALGLARPILERGIRLARTRLSTFEDGPLPATLLHRDFRTGNLLVNETGLVAVLDWEFAGLGDPMSDLGWFCARCWRFTRPDLEAGGLGDRATFYRGYTAAGGSIADTRVRWWEIVAHLRWAVIALQQGERHASGQQRSLALALTGRMADTLERDALGMMLDDRAALSNHGLTAPKASSGIDRTRTSGDTADGGLLVAAAVELTESLPPASEPLGLTLRMAIRAIKIAQREQWMRCRVDACERAVHSLAGGADPATIARAIRSGQHDDGALDQPLLELASVRGSIVDG